MKYLYYLFLKENKITDISGLGGLVALRGVDLRYNKDLNLAPGEKARWVISSLEDQGVIVIYMPYGDLDGNDEIDVQDAIVVLRGIVGLISFTAEQEVFGDVNLQDGVNVQDAILILRYIVDLIDDFPLVDKLFGFSNG